MLNPLLAPALTKALRPRPDDRPDDPPDAERHRTGQERSVVLLGVGSELRSDDAAGVRIAERMESLGLPGVHALAGGSAPENLTGQIRQLSPTHLVIIDTADMGLAPGITRILDPHEIDGMSFGTHALPLSVLAGYLKNETGCAVIILGIQPRSLEFDGALSAEVSQAVEEIVQAFVSCLSP